MTQFNEVLPQTLSRLSPQIRFPLRISQRKLLLIGVDLIMINIALFVGLTLNMNSLPTFSVIAPNPIWFVSVTLLWMAIASANDNYAVQQAAKLGSSIMGIVKTTIIMGLILTIIPLVFQPLFAQWPRFLLTGILIVCLLSLWRVFYATVLARPNFKRRALIAGSGVAGQAIAETIKANNSGYEIVGYIHDDSTEHEQGIQGVTLLGNWSNLSTYVQALNISDIVLTLPRDIQSSWMQAVLTCFEKGVRIVPMPELFEEITGRIPVEHIGERWLASLPINWDSKRLYLVLKRAMDIFIAGIGLLFLAPLFPIFILAIKLESPGPIFYRPIRLGQGGKSIRLWKFRTMVANADRIGDPTFTAKSDNRITRIGRILRLTHVDELPQFINILLGDMSLVGPRPERHVPEMEESIPYYRARYAVKPGATGWALVNQGYAEGLEDTLIKLEYDLYYIKHQSLTLDILILCRSAIHMLSMGGQ